MIPNVDIFSLSACFCALKITFFFMPLQTLYKSILEKLKNKDIQKYMATHYSTGILGTDRLYILAIKKQAT